MKNMKTTHIVSISMINSNESTYNEKKIRTFGRLKSFNYETQIGVLSEVDNASTMVNVSTALLCTFEANINAIYEIIGIFKFEENICVPDGTQMSVGVDNSIVETMIMDNIIKIIPVTQNKDKYGNNDCINSMINNNCIKTQTNCEDNMTMNVSTDNCVNIPLTQKLNNKKNSRSQTKNNSDNLSTTKLTNNLQIKCQNTITNMDKFSQNNIEESMSEKLTVKIFDDLNNQTKNNYKECKTSSISKQLFIKSDQINNNLNVLKGSPFHKIKKSNKSTEILDKSNMSQYENISINENICDSLNMSVNYALNNKSLPLFLSTILDNSINLDESNNPHDSDKNDIMIDIELKHSEEHYEGRWKAVSSGHCLGVDEEDIKLRDKVNEKLQMEKVELDEIINLRPIERLYLSEKLNLTHDYDLQSESILADRIFDKSDYNNITTNIEHEVTFNEKNTYIINSEIAKYNENSHSINSIEIANMERNMNDKDILEISTTKYIENRSLIGQDDNINNSFEFNKNAIPKDNIQIIGPSLMFPSEIPQNCLENNHSDMMHKQACNSESNNLNAMAIQNCSLNMDEICFSEWECTHYPTKANKTSILLALNCSVFVEDVKYIKMFYKMNALRDRYIDGLRIVKI